MRKLKIFSVIGLSISYLTFNLLPLLKGRWLPNGEYWRPISFFTDSSLETFGMACVIIFGVLFMTLVYSLAVEKIVLKRIKMWGLLMVLLVLLLLIQTIVVSILWGSDNEGVVFFLIFGVLPFFLISTAISFIVAMLSNIVAENKLAARAFPIASIAFLVFIALSVTEWFMRGLEGSFVGRATDAANIGLIVVFPCVFLGTMLIRLIIMIKNR